MKWTKFEKYGPIIVIVIKCGEEKKKKKLISE